MLVASGEQRLVQRQEVLGSGVADGDRGLEREEATIVERVVPDRRAAGLHMALRQRVRGEGD